MIVDPPYRRHVHDNARTSTPTAACVTNDFGFASLTEELRTWICQLAARTKRWSLIYTDVESVAKWKDTLELAGATYIRTLPWVRWSMPALSGDRPPQGFECIVVAYGSMRGRKRWNGAGNLTHLAQALEDYSGVDELLDQAANGDLDALTHLAHLGLRGKAKHKTEKPLDQLLDLVSWFSDPGETIVDPTAGSGTTCLAAKILGRNFVGCELSAEWCEKANERIRSCNVRDLPGSLSERDSERFLRWVNTTEKEKADSVSRRANTERVRKRLADKKAFLSLVPSAGAVTREEALAWSQQTAPTARAPTEDVIGTTMENEMKIPELWADAYQVCAVECASQAPKSSAAERTLPWPFEDKKWRTAYELAILELAPLSPTLRGVTKPPYAACDEDMSGFVDKSDPDFVALYSPSGVIPSHVIAELGMHPSLVDQPVRNRALAVARHTGWKADWIFLQENAPVGFFTRVLKELNMAPGERLSVLAEAMVARGFHVTPSDTAGWSFVQREVARACIAQGSEWPEFFDKYKTPRSADVCPACERGDERLYTHVCAKGEALGESKQIESVESKTAESVEPPAKRKGGRPPGTKNKMPKAWKDAMAQAVTELAS
jgi:site-specific DNA-methyltransferase (adenine-specific)